MQAEIHGCTGAARAASRQKWEKSHATSTPKINEYHKKLNKSELSKKIAEKNAVRTTASTATKKGKKKGKKKK